MLLSETVDTGNWVSIATVHQIGVLGGGVAECQLRTGNGDVIGGTSAANHDANSDSLTFNGGLLVASGADAISVWCKGPALFTWNGAQMLTLQVGGFGD
ncbi:MAG: hypothetical protein ACRDV9_00795 [Acidimicrobiia bacterium]